MAYSYLNNIMLKHNTRSKWYGGISIYRENLLCDVRIKEILFKATYYFKGFFITNHSLEISNVKKSRLVLLIIWYTKYNRKLTHDKIKGIVIAYLNKMISLDVISSLKIDVAYDSKPLSSAFYVAQHVANNMVFRINCRRLSLIALKVLKAGNIGCIIEIKGRINGHDISRKDRVVHGRIGRNTLINNVDFQRYVYIGRSGCVGIKVWINRGKLRINSSINK